MHAITCEPAVQEPEPQRPFAKTNLQLMLKQPPDLANLRWDILDRFVMPERVHPQLISLSIKPLFHQVLHLLYVICDFLLLRLSFGLVSTESVLRIPIQEQQALWDESAASGLRMRTGFYGKPLNRVGFSFSLALPTNPIGKCNFLIRHLAQSASRQVEWQSVASRLSGRTNKDCRKRWHNSLADSGNEGIWSPSEDERLRTAVNRYGTKWARVAHEVQTRNGDQCSKRWSHSVNPSLDRSPWTEEEASTRAFDD